MYRVKPCYLFSVKVEPTNHRPCRAEEPHSQLSLFCFGVESFELINRQKCWQTGWPPSLSFATCILMGLTHPKKMIQCPAGGATNKTLTHCYDLINKSQYLNKSAKVLRIERENLVSESPEKFFPKY